MKRGGRPGSGRYQACVWDPELIYMIAAQFSHVMLMQRPSNLQLGEKSITPQTPFSSPQTRAFLETTAILGHMTMGASCKPTPPHHRPSVSHAAPLAADVG